MRCKLHIIGLDEEFNTLATAAFGDAAICEVRDVTTVPRDGRIFVSPANSLGFMDGGIDAVYEKRMFPGVQASVQRAIKTLGEGHLTRLGRPYLRVGSALWTLFEGGDLSALITAPTMFLPHNVSGTRNAYWSFLAVLELADRIYEMSEANLHTIVCPALCRTERAWGRMPAAEAVAQMREALTDFEAGRKPTDVEDRGMRYLIWPSRDAEQPANREIGVGEYADAPVASLNMTGC